MRLRVDGVLPSRSGHADEKGSVQTGGANHSRLERRVVRVLRDVAEHIPRVLQQLPPTDEREALWSEFRGVLAGRMAFVFERLEDARSFFGFDGLKEWGFEA